MKVVVPFVDFRPELRRQLEDDGVRARYVDTSPPDGYVQLLRSLWDEADTVIVLEQDKFPVAGALQSLWDCPCEWGTYPVPMAPGGGVAKFPTLACTKFDRTLMLSDPGLMDAVGEIDLGFGVGEWSRLDMAIAALCENLTSCHWHEPGAVEHRHR